VNAPELDFADVREEIGQHAVGSSREQAFLEKARLEGIAPAARSW